MARPLSSEAREKTLRAATELMLEVGVRALTIDQVARRSGVAKTTIYRHFDGAEDLIVHAIDSLVAPLPTPNTGSLKSDLHAYSEVTLAATSDPRFRFLLLDVMAAATQNPKLDQCRASLMRERLNPVRTIIQLAMARGEIDPNLDLDLAVGLLESPFLGHLALHGVSAPTMEEVSVMIDFVVGGITSLTA